MRRWVCIVALLAGFSADDYTRGARPRMPIAIERPLEPAPRSARGRRHFTITEAWWGRP
jgi:hypothetical protein